MDFFVVCVLCLFVGVCLCFCVARVCVCLFFLLREGGGPPNVLLMFVRRVVFCVLFVDV